MERASRERIELVGRVLDRYQIERLVGEGGFGAVYSARHTVTGRRVALKVLLPDHDGADVKTLERFVQEARAAAAIGSPHIVDVLDAGATEDGKHFLVMEYLEGTDLEHLLESEGPIAPERAVDLATQVLEALAAAHAKGIVHRDLKPGNIFVCKRNGREFVKLLDFGISKMIVPERLENLTKAGIVLGTPHYMAPEQLMASHEVDGRADVWALATVLYEMVADRRPFEAETVQELFLRVHTEPPTPLAAIAKAVPAPLAQVIERGLARDRDARWSSAHVMADALARVMRGDLSVLSGGGATIPAVNTPLPNPGMRPGHTWNTPLPATRDSSATASPNPSGWVVAPPPRNQNPTVVARSERPRSGPQASQPVAGAFAPSAPILVTPAPPIGEPMAVAYAPSPPAMHAPHAPPQPVGFAASPSAGFSPSPAGGYAPSHPVAYAGSYSQPSAAHAASFSGGAPMQAASAAHTPALGGFGHGSGAFGTSSRTEALPSHYPSAAPVPRASGFPGGGPMGGPTTSGVQPNARAPKRGLGAAAYFALGVIAVMLAIGTAVGVWLVLEATRGDGEVASNVPPPVDQAPSRDSTAVDPIDRPMEPARSAGATDPAPMVEAPSDPAMVEAPADPPERVAAPADPSAMADAPPDPGGAPEGAARSGMVMSVQPLSATVDRAAAQEAFSQVRGAVAACRSPRGETFTVQVLIAQASGGVMSSEPHPPSGASAAATCAANALSHAPPIPGSYGIVRVRVTLPPG
jgi:serine/threonine protein kinase